MSKFFQQAAAMAQAQTRIVETLGVPFADPFNEEAVISAVDDPEKLGRVKVTTDDGFVSNWIPVAGSSSGTLSARYIGAKVLVGKTNGRSENMYVIGIIKSDKDVGISGSPFQLPMIDESMAAWNNTSDPGMKCNKENEGRSYILSNEMNQDVVVCLRRSNPQVGSKPSWSWKSLTNGLWVEKGVNPGNETTIPIEQAQVRNPGIPECNEAFLGEKHDFTEDRGFRTTTMVCRRDENKQFSWLPESSPPVFFRTTLPTCNEKLHGMEAVVDDGGNSEIVKCLRYQGLMRWVKEGSRIPHKFHSKDKPPTKTTLLDIYNPIPALEENLYSAGYDWVKEKDIRDVVFDAVIPQISLTNTDPVLRQLLVTAGLIPAQAFNGAQVLSTAAREALNRRTGVPVDTLTNTIRQQLDTRGALTPETAQLLVGTGDAGRTLLEGVRAGTVEGALANIGQNTLRNALLSLSPKTASVMTGMMAGGVWGAVDTAAILGLSQLPPEVNKYVQPVLGIAKNVLSGYPTALGSVLNTASGGGLTAALSSTFNSVIGRNAVTPQLLGSISGLLGSGGLGPVGQMFSGLGNLAGIPMAPGPLGALPLLASTAMGSLGLGGAVSSLFGVAGGGLGFGGLTALLGASFNPASAILLGIGALSSLFGSGGGNCPCDPKCRKTEHGVDSDGLKLLNPCGALTSTNANPYSGFNNSPIPNNFNEIAEVMGLSPTLVGLNLIPSNIRDLSEMILTKDRMRDMAVRYHDSRYADKPEKDAETAYTFEAIEKGFKMADNNITRVESVERKLIDSAFNILQNIFWKPEGAVLEKLITDARENAQAIRDIFNYVKTLDAVKDGPRIGVSATPGIAASIENIPGLAGLYKENVEETKKIMQGGVKPADKEWRTMKPGMGFESVLGEYPEVIPDVFPSERTIFDEPRVLALSLDAKILDDLQEETAPIDQLLSPAQIERLKDNFINRSTGQAEPLPLSSQGVTTVSVDTPLPEGAVLPTGTVFPPGNTLPTGVPLPSGTILPAGSSVPSAFFDPPQPLSVYDELKARESGEINCE
jgi:hypothetical protein